MIEYGEVKSKLGSELEVYAEKTWEEFFLRINRAMNFIQPLVFIFVALVIVYSMRQCSCPFIRIWRFIYNEKNLKTLTVQSIHPSWKC